MKKIKLMTKKILKGLFRQKLLFDLLYVLLVRILHREIPDECWKDRTLQDCYIKYVRSQEREKGMCYLTGNMESISYLHSKKIRNEGDGAKLISANDSQNFTYRGRFANREEAVAVGSGTSQIVHNTFEMDYQKTGSLF